MSTRNATRWPGITIRHQRACKITSGGRCNCQPSYRAEVMRDGQRVRQTFASLKAAMSWRSQAVVGLEQGTIRASLPTTVADEAKDFIDGMRDGRVRNRKGGVYKAASIRGYERTLRLHVLPALGKKKLTDVRRADVQDLVDKLVAEGLGGSTVRNALDPLRRIFVRALQRDKVAVNPCSGLEMPGTPKGRDRVASPVEAKTLIAALADGDRALWATALYAGLRSGELRALRCGDVDLDAGVVHVRRGWDDVEGEQTGKSEAAHRTVPIIPELRQYLLAHLMATGRRGDDFMFGRTATGPFLRSTPRSRARKAWEAAGLTPITMHECRHTYASTMIAAGVDPGEVMRRMGHTTVALTLDRYTHGLAGTEAATASKMQAFIDEAAGA